MTKLPALTRIGGTQDKHGESGTNYYLLPRHDSEGNDVLPRRSMVRDYLDKGRLLPVGGCGHEHDCCGCLFFHGPDVIGLDTIRDEWIIAQGWGRNV